MQDLIDKNYQSIVDRGLITPSTTIRDFILKLNEEIDEFKQYYRKTTKIDPQELADIIMVCLNMAKHYDIDIEKEIKDKIEINFKRAKQDEKNKRINN